MQLVFGRDGGPAGQVLWQLIGSGLHLVPFVSLNLKVGPALKLRRLHLWPIEKVCLCGYPMIVLHPASHYSVISSSQCR